MSYVKKAYRGIHDKRYSREPLEKKFAEAWQALDEERGGQGFETLRVLLCPPDHPPQRPPPISDRDRQVAATMIQWLGSAVGQRFLSEAMDGKRPNQGKGTVFGSRGRRQRR